MEDPEDPIFTTGVERVAWWSEELGNWPIRMLRILWVCIVHSHPCCWGEPRLLHIDTMCVQSTRMSTKTRMSTFSLFTFQWFQFEALYDLSLCGLASKSDIILARLFSFHPRKPQINIYYTLFCNNRSPTLHYIRVLYLGFIFQINLEKPTKYFFWWENNAWFL